VRKQPNVGDLRVVHVLKTPSTYPAMREYWLAREGREVVVEVAYPLSWYVHVAGADWHIPVKWLIVPPKTLAKLMQAYRV
jgi:hypothetical protein